MKVIFLIGERETGKTTIMHRVADYLYNQIDLRTDVITPKTEVGGDQRDFHTAITYNGKRVYIYSLGDLSGEICEAMADALENSYDILICCSRPHFKRPMCFLEKNSPYYVRVEKHSPTDSDNDCAFNRIIELLNNLIK